MSRNTFLHWPLAKVPFWVARWIAPEGIAAEPNTFFRARFCWVLEDVPQSGLLHIVAESSYLLTVNGRLVGRGPVRGTRSRSYFDTYEIASLLRTGKNWIAVAAQCPNVSTFKVAPAEPGVLVQLDDGKIVASGSDWQVQSADEWRRDVRSYTFQIGFLEWGDLSGEPPGWQVGEDESAWSAPRVLTTDERLGGKILIPRDIPALEETSDAPVKMRRLGSVPRISDVQDGTIAKLLHEEPHQANVESGWDRGAESFQIAPPDDGGGVALMVIFDREINGAFEIEMIAPAGVVVDIAHDEDEHGGRLPVLINAYAFADRYFTKEGRQVVGNVFTERGFRVVQVVLREFSEPVTILGVRGINRLYPFRELGTFHCSDKRLDDLWAACLHTLRACATDTFVDCPWRENTLYLNDLLVENVVALQAFGDARLAARSFRLAASQVRPDGLIPAAVPCGVMPDMSEKRSEDLLTLLAGNLFLPQMLDEYLAYTGDEALVRDMLPIAFGVVNAFSAWEDGQGLIQPPAHFWNFVDWSFEMHSYDLSNRNTAVLNWIYVIALGKAAQLAGRFGDSQRESILRDKADAVAIATDQKFWSEERQCYVEWLEDGVPGPVASQLSQALAVLSGRAPEAKHDALVKALTDQTLLAPELYLHHFVLRALTKSGKALEALSVVEEHWLPILAAGSPTIWECGVHEKGRKAFNGNGSGCHGFATTPVDFLQTVVLGVTPSEPGFVACRIAPQTLGLSFAEGCIPTPHGLIEVSWRQEGEAISLSVNLPLEVRAELPWGEVIQGGTHCWSRLH